MNMAMNSPDLRHLHSGGTIGNLVVNAVVRFGDQPALADGKVRWSYREFGDTMGRFISLFRSLGLKKGSALSILASNRAEAWAAICAALVMGVPHAAASDGGGGRSRLYYRRRRDRSLIVEGASSARAEWRSRAGCRG